MVRTRAGRTALLLTMAAGMLAAAAGEARGQAVGLDPDTVRAGPLDYGKMWTFEYPPADYFTATYGFEADSAWFARARLSALRVPGCSASLVSDRGLVVTNHHCIRSRVSAVARAGEVRLALAL